MVVQFRSSVGGRIGEVVGERVLLNKGTIEHLIVDVRDRLKNLTSLTGTNAAFDIRLEGSDTWLVTASPATVAGMSAYCLVDTTPSGFVDGVYELFLYFNNLPEVPRLGPFEFEVNS